MSRPVRFFPLLLLVTCSAVAVGQSTDSIIPKKKSSSKWGIEAVYAPASYTESAIFSLQLSWTGRKHSVALAPHVAHQELFAHPVPWERLGFDLQYLFFPFRTDRICSPYVMYDIGYAYLGTTYTDRAVVDGQFLSAQVRSWSHTLAHHLGIGAQFNIYRGLFANVAIAAGIGTYGENEKVTLTGSGVVNRERYEHPFSNTEMALMARVGIGYRLVLPRRGCEQCP
jgi:hypothetical protein